MSEDIIHHTGTGHNRPFPKRRSLALPERFRRLIREMACRLEGLIIGALVAGLLAYSSGLKRGERQAEDCWAALDAEHRYQEYGDTELQKFEDQTEKGAK